MVAIATLACEIISVHKGQVKPFPYATISNTADHYPSYIIFRITTSAEHPLVIISWFLNYFLIKTKDPKARRYLSCISVILGTCGAFVLMGSTATLATGKHYIHWHTLCATTFFVLTILACLYNTLMCYLVSRKVHSFENGTMIVKYILTALLTVWLYLALFYHSPNKNFGNIVEYALAYLILAYIFLIGYDLKNFMLDYELELN